MLFSKRMHLSNTCQDQGFYKKTLQSMVKAFWPSKLQRLRILELATSLGLAWSCYLASSPNPVGAPTSNYYRKMLYCIPCNKHVPE